MSGGFDDTSAGKFRIPRNRGAIVGAFLVLLGTWGVLVPFFGEQLGLSYGAAEQWEWTAARGWLQVLPGFVAIIGGIVLALSRNRFAAVFGAWLSAVAGAWFIVGRAVAEPFGVGFAGTPATAGAAETMWIEIANFTGLGALILLFAGMIVGRLSVRSVRDIRYASTASTRDQHSDEHGERLTNAASQHRQGRRWRDVFRRQNATPAH